MLVNPDIQAWFEKLQGHPLARGGSAPRGQILPNYGADAISGIVQPGRGMFGFNAPAIAARYEPRVPAPYPGPRAMTGIAPAMPSSSGAGARDLGGGAIAAGLGKLGQGAESALGDLAAKQKAKQADLDAVTAAGLNGPSAFGTTPAPPVRPGEPTPVSRPAGLGPPAETFPPVGAASTLPLQAQTGGGVGETGTAIGPGGSLPTFAQGGGAAVAGGPGFVNQFLTGIKAGEGTPYSGFSPTGAIGAYGLTGGFIKQWAPSAGLPTDRDSYKGNAELQDKLATHAATQMYNKYGSWDKVSNAWLTGSPTATVSAPGNMSPAAYTAKVMKAANAAQPGQPPLSSPSASAYAAAAPTLQESSASQVAGPGAPEAAQHGTYNGQDYIYQPPAGGSPAAPAAPSGNGQSVTPGQGDPHLPGFDPKSVPFINTPIGGQQQSMNTPQVNQLAAALAQGGTQPQPIDQSALLALALSQGESPDFGGFGGFFG